MVQSNKKDFSGQNIAIGIDVHLRTWSVTVLTPSGFMRTHSQKASAKELFEHLNKHYPNGSYHAAYETGFSGFSTYYSLTELGIECTVVHAADVPTTQKEKSIEVRPGGFKKAGEGPDARGARQCVHPLEGQSRRPCARTPPRNYSEAFRRHKIPDQAPAVQQRRGIPRRIFPKQPPLDTQFHSLVAE